MCSRKTSASPARSEPIPGPWPRLGGRMPRVVTTSQAATPPRSTDSAKSQWKPTRRTMISPATGASAVPRKPETP